MASNQRLTTRRRPEMIDGRPRWVFQIMRATGMGHRQVDREVVGDFNDAREVLESGAKRGAPRKFGKVKRNG